MPGDHTPRRIACLQPSATVILNALGELDRVVACTRYCADVVPAVSDGSRTVLADSWTANSAQISAVRPDLVIAAVPFQEKALAEILKSGARVLGLAPKTLADIYTDIATIAGTVGKASGGEEAIQGMQQHIQKAREQVANRKRPRVFCEEWGKPIISSQPWVAELVDAAGGQFVGTPAHRRSSDEVAALDPEIVIAAWCGAGNRVPLEKIISGRGWAQTSAGLSGRVFCIRDELLNTPAPTVLGGLDALCWAIHPEIFPRTRGIRQISGVPPLTQELTARELRLRSSMTRLEDVRAEVTALAESSPAAQDLMQAMAKLLHDKMLTYNWVGFYMLEPGAQPPVLVLGAFEGAMTPHTRIPLNQGICGAAASSGQTVVVDDVSKDSRYLACSLETKSEIVVPVFAQGKVVGELDIDSHFPAAFTVQDQEFVQHCAMLVGKKLETAGA